MPLLPLLLFFLLSLPMLFFLTYAQVAALSFARLGLSPAGAFLLFALSLVGSGINLPLRRERVPLDPPPVPPIAFFWLFPMVQPPRVAERVLAINVGGAVIPTLFSLFLLGAGRAPLVAALVATVLVAAVAKALARPVPGRGIVLPAFIPPLAAVVITLLVAPPGSRAAVAYVAGTLGTLVGADLLNLRALDRMGPGMLSIGGAGVFDGIFLVGVLAAFLA
ncbi:DUF1614 domain-containing protein [Thermaerobacter subterraneus]|uniref:Membrane protein n=1 Tax=Thermaerobacter subterraneus DSM 13965 TaxID=867903 RepID=K6Q1S7_9FIRM|nr:DUF1614 domain-containing protein [Thermaerobacter subterraneus]EKP95123.1 putative membrane protein [Thermaerobacter subterraneus DSM 13965]